MTRLPLILLFFSLAACTQFPELDASVPDALEEAEFPALIPLENLPVDSDGAVQDNEEVESHMQARLARLKARAARLRNSEI